MVESQNVDKLTQFEAQTSVFIQHLGKAIELIEQGDTEASVIEINTVTKFLRSLPEYVVREFG